MSGESSSEARDGHVVHVDTFGQGPVPVMSDENGYVVFDHRLEAQREIADYQMTRLSQFLDGERDFEDAMAVEEYVVPATVRSDEFITDADGNGFGPNVE